MEPNNRDLKLIQDAKRVFWYLGAVWQWPTPKLRRDTRSKNRRSLAGCSLAVATVYHLRVALILKSPQPV